MNKSNLNERDICSKFITPAILKSGWDLTTQIREEVRFTKGCTIVRGKLVTRQRRHPRILGGIFLKGLGHDDIREAAACRDFPGHSASGEQLCSTRP
jgi:hypothetical protein